MCAKRGTQLLVIAVLVAFGCGLAFADALNPRPFTDFGTSLDGSGNSLQDVFNNITVAGTPPDAINDQISAALFTSTANGNSVASFIIEIAGNENGNTFGIYQAGNSNFKATVFNGAQTQGSKALISFGGGGDISVAIFQTSVGGFVSETIYTGFGNTFGFYLSGPGGTFYSEDSLNNGNPQALIYQGKNTATLGDFGFASGLFTPNEFIIAFEDLPFNSSDKDFNDLVVIVESIAPVPEPGTLLLIGSGLAGLAIYGRRRRQA